MIKRVLVILLFPFISVFLVCGISSAIPTLFIKDFASPIELYIEDNGSLDSDNALGVVNYDAIFLDDWDIEITARTKPFIGDPTLSVFYVDALVSYTGTGIGQTLRIGFTEDDFIYHTTEETFLDFIANGNAENGAFGAISYADGSNQLFGNDELLAEDIMNYIPDEFNYTSRKALLDTSSSSYSLTAYLYFLARGAGDTSSEYIITPYFEPISSVPDASIILLLGSSLMGLAVFSGKSKRI